MREPDPPILDESVLDELAASLGGDDAFVVELVETYLADTPSQLDAIAAAGTADDAAALVRPAHTLKSSSATVGAVLLSGTSRRLELAGRSGTLDSAVRDDIEAVKAAWAATQTALRAWLAAQS